MSIFKMGTKIQAVLTVAFILVLSLSSIFALQVTYSDTGVTYDVAGVISNSNGHIWAATGANIQTAIWDLNSTGGTVYLPNGIIETSTAIVMTNHSSLIGSGNTTIRLEDSSSMTNHILIIMGESTSFSLSSGKFIHDVLIENIRLNGNCDNNVWTTHDYGIIMGEGCRNITIRHCEIYNTGSDCIRVHKWNVGDIPPEYVIIENCILRDIDKHSGDYPGGVAISGQHCVVRNCFINNTWAVGICFEAADRHASFNIADGNFITGCITIGVYQELAAYAENNTIINNFIYDLDGRNTTGVTAYGGNDSKAIICGMGTICSNNIIKNIHGTEFGATANRIIDAIRTATITGNIIYGNGYGYGIYFRHDGSYTGLNDILISNNRIYDCNKGINFGAPTAFVNVQINSNYMEDCDTGVYVSSGSDNITITCNVIKNFVTDGIRMHNSNDCIVSLNRCGGAGDGIQSTGTSDYNTFIGNNLRYCGTALNLAGNANSNITLNIV